MNLAPIGLSTYTRLSHLKKTVEALKANTLASMSELYVFTDAPKSGDEKKVMAVRQYAEAIKGFRRIHVVKRKTNNRIKNSRDGISNLLDKYQKCIFIEEDIVTSPGFLTFMNDSLNVFEDNKQIFSISGYSPPLDLPKDYTKDTFILRRACGWGIGLWQDRYKKIKYLDLTKVKKRLSKQGQIEELTKFGEDLFDMVLKDAAGKIDALDVKIFYHQFLNEKYTIYPRKSLVMNIGHDGSGVHCGSTNKFNVDLWNKKEFNINKDVKLDYRIVMSNYRFRQVSDSLEAINTSSTLWQKDGENEKILGNNLIFLISQPRAGSTLLQRLFSGHPEIHTTAEPWLMLHPLYALKENGIETEYHAETARHGLADYLMQVPESMDLYKSAIRRYGITLYNRALEISGKRLFLDKTPRYYHIIPELHNIFPEAKFIILLRNPLAVLSSVLKTWCHNRVDNIQPSYLIDLVKGPVCLINGIKILKDDAIVVDYESLVQDPEKVMMKVCSRIGIPYDQDMLNYGRRPKPKGRFGDQVGIYKHSRPVTENINKWKKNYTSIELVEYAEQYIKTLGADVISKMGYSYNDISKELCDQRQWCLNLEKVSEEVRSINKDVKSLTDRGFITEAEKLLRKAYKLEPNDSETNNNLGCVYYQKGETKRALFHFLKAVEYSTEKNEFQKNLAEFYNKTGKIETAIEIYLKILKEKPDDFDVMFSLAGIYKGLGNYHESFYFCQKALDKYPQKPEIRELFLHLGEKIELSGDLNKAREVYLYYLNCNFADESITRKWLKLKDNLKKEDIIKKITARVSDYTVSAIVSTYNSEEFIRECLENLETQTISKNIEIIVIDAASEQNEENVVKEFQARFHNITYIKTRKRVGIYAAWNIGARETKGKYIITASTNDSLRCDACEILSKYLDDHPDCMLVYGDTYLTKTPHQSFESNTHDDEYRWFQYSYKEHLDKCLVGPHPMWRKEIHSEIGYFDENYNAVGDQEFWLRIGEKYNISHIPKFTGLQWITDNAISKQGLLPELEIKHIQSIYKKRFASTGNNQNVLVSIIIPVFNQLEYTKQCIDALYKYTPQSLFELIVVDNNSTDGTERYLNTLSGNIKIIKNKKNKGFSIACNQGANIATGEYVLFLNNDTEVLPNWLESLIKIIEKDQSVAAVGSKLLFPNRTIQHAGVVVINNKKISDTLNAIHIYYGQKEDFAETNKPRCYQVLTGACLLIRRKYFENVKGFDEQYWNGYEDVDLCFKLHGKGWKLIYQPESVVIHHESKSGMERFSKTQQNIDLLNQKWMGKITPDLIIEKDGAIKETNANHVREYNYKTDNYTIKHEKEQNIKVSIIILTLNQVEYTRKCIESINCHTNIPYEIIVVDNGSTDETLEYLYSLKKKNKHQKELTIIENKKNLGFAGGNNVGLGLSKGEYVLMMNNDIVVTPCWLDLLIDSSEKSLAIGIIGPKSNQVSGTQFVANVQYNQETLEGLNRFSKKFTKENSGKSHHTLRVVGFCMLVKRAVIDKIGGMDDRFGLGNFEDDDFSIRAALAGFESWTAEDCFVHHFGSRTFIGEKIDYGKSLHKNWNIFKDKWGLPADLPYGSPYSISQMKVNKFNPQVHYIPISENNEKPVQNWIENVSTVEQEYSTVCSSFDKENLEIAIEKLQRFADKYKDFAMVYNDLGVFYYKTGNNESALKHYRKALNLDQNNISFRKNLADLLAVAFAEYEEALQHYVTVLASEPKDVEALLATGHICARLERYDDAAEFYEKVLEADPLNSDAQNWLAKMREKRSANSSEVDKNDCYLKLLSEIAQEDLAGAITKIENFIEMYPTHGQAHNDLGVLFYKNESKTKVLAHYLKAVELEPENVTFRKNLADFLYVEESRVEEALENYVEVLRIKPDDVETLLITGHICTAIERYEDAMSFYHKVLNLEPQNLDARQNMEALEKRQISMFLQEARGEEKPDDDTEINQVEPHASIDEVPMIPAGVVEDLINKADLLFQQERIEQAVDAMLKAIAVNPLDGWTYIELARQLINHGSNENALEVLAEMPANQPEDLEKQKLVLEGYCQEGMGNYAAAKKCNDGVLAREPKNAKALNLNGILAYRNGDKETAEQHFKRVIELDSEYGEPHTNLGALVWENGKPKMALEHYERGFSILPTDIDVANAYHEAVTATGEYKRAEKAARSALKKYPQCRKVLYLLVDTLIRQEKNEEALKELETALSSFGVDKGLLDTALAFRERVGKIKKTVSSKKPGVSLCMIVKDEEANLAHCLASVKPIVDEMIVVDTGSTDRTRDIAEFFGARVYDFEWKGDFAEARNFSMSKAKGGWILILDADEVISSKDYVKFQSIVRRRPKKPIAYSIITRNYCTLANTIGWETNLGEYPAEEAGFGWLPSVKVRLFYGRNRVRFEGAVHEMVDPVLKRAHIPVKSCHIPVHHYGRLDTERMYKKGKIYYDLGRRKLEESSCDHAAVRELATQATILGKNEEAVDLWHRFLKMSPPDRAIAEAHVNLATLYLRLQDYKAARNISEKVLSKVPEMKEARYNLALSELYLGNAGRTVEVLERIVKDHPLYPPAQFILAATCFINGKKEQSESLLENLKKGPFGPVLTRSFAELVRDLNAAGRFDYAQQLLESALENKIVDAQILTQLSLTLPNSPQPVAVAG